MANRWVFLMASLTTVLIVAGAFALPQLFYFELAKAAIFMAIAVLVFFGEDRVPYMLGMIFTPLWFLVDILVGVFFDDFGELFSYFQGKGVGLTETPLHAFARLSAVGLFFFSLYCWRKQVPERMVGKTFWISLAISVGYVAILSFWYLHLFPSSVHH